MTIEHPQSSTGIISLLLKFNCTIDFNDKPSISPQISFLFSMKLCHKKKLIHCRKCKHFLFDTMLLALKKAKGLKRLKFESEVSLCMNLDTNLAFSKTKAQETLKQNESSHILVWLFIQHSSKQWFHVPISLSIQFLTNLSSSSFAIGNKELSSALVQLQ